MGKGYYSIIGRFSS